jgi:hypothetical protein
MPMIKPATAPTVELWSTETLAERLSVSPSLIEKARCTGSLDIPFVRIGRVVRYPAHTVSAWVERNLVKE